MSQAVSANGFVFLAGQVPDDYSSPLSEQVSQTLAKIEHLLSEAGSNKQKLVCVNIYLAHITDFDAMNKVYDNWIDAQHPPARVCTEARMADPSIRVEMTAVAIAD